MTSNRINPHLLKQFQQILTQGKLSHAYLLTGDVTSFDLAIYLTQSCFCENLTDGLPCQRCRSCQQVADQSLVDLLILEPEGTVIKTQAVRDMLAKASTSGLEGRRQVFMIKEAEKLHPNAANALLKVIEEPPGDFYIFLLSKDADAILPTIKSRCQCFYFPKNTAYWEEALVAGGVSLSQAKLLSQLINTSDDITYYQELPHLSNLIRQTQKFLEAILARESIALLLSARVANLANDRRQQGLVFELLLLLLVKKALNNRTFLAKITKAQAMWQSHVTFQSALDYLVL